VVGDSLRFSQLRGSVNGLLALENTHYRRFWSFGQPENPSIPLIRPFVPATVLCLAPLALRVWAFILPHQRPATLLPADALTTNH
jgi:hypothetical protein